MIYLIIFAFSFVLWLSHDFLCYCFMQHKKISFKTLSQWWYGEIDKE